MNKRATLALLLSVGVVGPAWAQEVDCDSSKVLKSVIAVSGNRHAVDANGQLIGNPPVNTWDIYLLDPDQVDANGILSVWRHLPGTDSDSAPAISPDGKGRIVFDSNRNRGPEGFLNTADLFLMKADGSDQRLLTRGSSATWSPDGKRIAFHASASGVGVPVKTDPGAPTTDSVIFVAKVGDLLEGEAPRQITHPLEDDPQTEVDEGQIDDDADWSPVGEKLVFTRKSRVDADPRNPTSAEIYAVNVDGTGLTRLTENEKEERSPAWSPDGERVVYSCREGTLGGNTLEICVMNLADRTAEILTNNTLADLSPHWTPDGEKILFQRPVANPPPGQGQQTWVMNSVRNPDGTVPTAYKLTSPPGAHMFPTWGEIKAKCGEKHDQDDEEN